MKSKRKHKRSEKVVPEKKTPVSITLSKKKIWFFRLISLLLLPVLFFGILEAGLRYFHYGFPPSAIIKYQLGDKEVYCHNYKFGWRFFPHSISRHFDGFVFDTEKSPGTYRIFVLGASAAAGVPAPAYNFGHILEVMLDELYPDMDFEVLTVAMPAVNSHVVLEVTKDCARHQPDLFIVYLGNNEIVGPYGPGTVFTPLSPSLPVIRANIAFKSMRTGQLVEQVVQSIKPRGATPKQWGGLEMFLNNQVRYDAPSLEITYDHFEQNLRDICQTGLNSGASVIVSNVCSNLRGCSPFASLHRSDLTETQKQTWQDIYEEGVSIQKEGQFEQAIAKYLDAEKIDDVFADLQFRLGQCYWGIGDYQKAKERYIKAREYDALRFRADNQINEVIGRVAENRQEDRLYYIDSIAAIESESPHNVPGEELFFEHVHLKFKGNYILAKTLLPVVQKNLPPAHRKTETRIPSESEVAKSIGYTDYEEVVYLNLVLESFLKQPPFTNQLNNEQTVATAKQVIDQKLLNLKRTGLNHCLMQHKAAVQKRPDDWNMRFQYAAFLNSGMHDIKAEEVELRKVIKICPYYSAYLNLGINLHHQAKIKESLSVLNYLLELNPNSVEAYVELASIYRQRREYDVEIDYLLKALTLEPEGLISIHLDLANAYDNIGNTDEAIQVLYRAIKLFPEAETANAHLLLAYLLYNRNNYQEALQEIQCAFKIDPSLKNNPAHNTFLQNLQK